MKILGGRGLWIDVDLRFDLRWFIWIDVDLADGAKVPPLPLQWTFV